MNDSEQLYQIVYFRGTRSRKMTWAQLLGAAQYYRRTAPGMLRRIEHVGRVQ